MALPEPRPRDWRLTDPQAAADLFAPLADEPVEILAFAYLDAGQHLLGLRHVRSHFADLHALPVRDVVRDALAFGAEAVVMAHNHPSGDSSPSEADRAATRLLARALDLVEIRLLDHLVIGRDGVTSFKGLGLL